MALLTAYWGLDSIIVLTTLVVTVYLYMTRKYNYWKKRGVFEVPPTPIFGNFSDIMFMKKNPGFKKTNVDFALFADIRFFWGLTSVLITVMDESTYF